MVASLVFLSAHRVFTLWFQEQKYPAVASWFTSNTPPTSVARSVTSESSRSLK